MNFKKSFASVGHDIFFGVPNPNFCMSFSKAGNGTRESIILQTTAKAHCLE